jgi:hypothetical protein
MTSRELVTRAIERTGPDRIPLYYTNRDAHLSDLYCVGAGGATGIAPAEPGMTEWGFVWESLDKTMGQPHTHPLADSRNIATYCPPDPYAAGRFDHMEQVLQNAGDKFRMMHLGITGFNQATFLRGFEAFLEDLYCEPDDAAKVLDYVIGYETGLIEQSGQYDIDAIAFGDDWGTQQGLMISPNKWKEVFKPRYKEQFDLIHKQGRKVWYHSCGNVWDMIPDMIEIGVDVFEFLQPDVFGVENLAREFGGHVSFACSVDHQRRAITGTREEIFAYTSLLRDTLGSFNGGYIGYLEFYDSMGMTEQTYQWIHEAFQSL